MSLKSFIGKIYAKIVVNDINKWRTNPIETQNNVFNIIVSQAKNTSFGKEHKFHEINSYEDFKARVPVKDYEALKPYFDRVKNGESDVMWPNKPIYLCKTSGTTSGTKYIPISKESISNHIDSARNALMCYIAETGKADFIDGKMIFLQGSPELNDTNGIPTGRLSGIVAHHVPAYLMKNRLPSMITNTIDDWETKVDAIVNETLPEKMTLISGIPPWVQMYFEKLIEKSGKQHIKDIFPDFSLFVYGGVNFEPYRPAFNKLIGKKIDSIEVYPASEGFIAFQDLQKENGLLLILNKGIFYEFIPVNEFNNENPTRISLKDVKLDVNYVIILNTNAGLWGYNIGDTVKFVSINPYRIIVTGRIKHFTSAFGEHVIAEEVEYALNEAVKNQIAVVNEFHVAPQVSVPEGSIAYHEWFVEFEQEPANLDRFIADIDNALQQKNSYYYDLRQGNMLDCIKISKLKKGGFNEFMKSRGKLGGQNKTPRLGNDRSYADELANYLM